MTREQERRYYEALPAGMSTMIECRTVLENARRMLRDAWGYMVDNAPREIEEYTNVIERTLNRLEAAQEQYNDRIKDAEEEAYQAATKGA